MITIKKRFSLQNSASGDVPHIFPLSAKLKTPVVDNPESPRDPKSRSKRHSRNPLHRLKSPQ